ncbi:MAG: hypothetical protein KJ736_07215, partial [Candidatus Omnitrophica bacterium]|nr:hypothetical protein [Candidatus Omnitrophota bacterium]
LRLSKKCKIRYSKKVLGEYIVHNLSVSSRIEKQSNSLMNVIDSHFNDMKRKSLIHKYKMQIRRSEVYRQAGRDLLKVEQVSSAIKYALRTFYLNPFNLKNMFLFAKIFVNHFNKFMKHIR